MQLPASILGSLKNTVKPGGVGHFLMRRLLPKIDEAGAVNATSAVNSFLSSALPALKGTGRAAVSAMKPGAISGIPRGSLYGGITGAVSDIPDLFRDTEIVDRPEAKDPFNATLNLFRPKTIEVKRSIGDKAVNLIKRTGMGAIGGTAVGASIGATRGAATAAGKKWLGQARAFDVMGSSGVLPQSSLELFDTGKGMLGSRLREAIAKKDIRSIKGLTKEFLDKSDTGTILQLTNSDGSGDFSASLLGALKDSGVSKLNAGMLMNPKIPTALESGAVQQQLSNHGIKEVYGKIIPNTTIKINPEASRRLSNLNLPEAMGVIPGQKYQAPRDLPFWEDFKQRRTNLAVLPTDSTIEGGIKNIEPRLNKFIASLSPLEKARIGLSDDQLKQYAHATLLMGNNNVKHIWKNPRIGEAGKFHFSPSADRRTPVNPFSDPSVAHKTITQQSRAKNISPRQLAHQSIDGTDIQEFGNGWFLDTKQRQRLSDLLIKHRQDPSSVDFKKEFLNLMGMDNRQALRAWGHGVTKPPITASTVTAPVEQVTKSIEPEQVAKATEVLQTTPKSITKAVKKDGKPVSLAERIAQRYKNPDTAAIQSAIESLPKQKQQILELVEKRKKVDPNFNASKILANFLGFSEDELPVIFSKGAMLRLLKVGINF